MPNLGQECKHDLASQLMNICRNLLIQESLDQLIACPFGRPVVGELWYAKLALIVAVDDSSKKVA